MQGLSVSHNTSRAVWLCIYTDVLSFLLQLIPGLLFWAVINCMRVKEKSRISAKTVPRLVHTLELHANTKAVLIFHTNTHSPEETKDKYKKGRHAEA